MRDVTPHCLIPLVLLRLSEATGVLMSACASGTPPEQHALGVQPLTPSYVCPVARARLGFLLMIRCTVAVYVGSAVASAPFWYRLSVALDTVAPAGMLERSNFIKIALATLASGHVYSVRSASVE